MTSDSTLQTLLEKLKTVCASPQWSIYFSSTRGAVPGGGRQGIHPAFRFITPLVGEKLIYYHNGRNFQKQILKMGEVIIGFPGTCIVESWVQKHEMLSVVYNDSFIRVINIAYDGPPAPPPKPAEIFYFYHTVEPPQQPIPAIITAIENAERSVASRDLFRALLEATHEQLQAESPGAFSAEDLLWQRISSCFQACFTHDIGLEDFADELGLTTKTLTRRLRLWTGMTFREYLTHLRLNYAERLLVQTSLSCEDIAKAVGFNYCNYFIRTFHQHYGVSPGNYRKKTEKTGTDT